MLYTLPEEPGPVDFFHIFIHDVDILVRETNCYAEQYITSAILGSESDQKYVALTPKVCGSQRVKHTKV